MKGSSSEGSSGEAAIEVDKGTPHRAVENNAEGAVLGRMMVEQDDRASETLVIERRVGEQHLSGQRGGHGSA
jgi:hypothetical protein